MKKGFTLIELLAVIVILAVISLIATPMILGVIETSKESSAKVSAYGYIDAVETQVAINQLDANKTNIEDGVYEVEELKNTYGLVVKGELPTSNSWVKIEKGQVVDYSLKIGEYVVNYSESGVTITRGGEITTKTDGLTKSGATKVEASETDTHKGIVYLDPTDLTKVCNAENSISTTEIKTGCMKWYIFNDDGDNYTMILDHNTTARVAWNLSGNNVDGMKEVLEALINDTNSWNKIIKSTVRLITAEEIAKITGNTIFNSSTSTTGGWFYLDSNNQTQTATTQGASKYAWLFDYTNSCANNGCNMADSSTYGYWTQTTLGTAGSGSFVWIVGSSGYLYYNYVNYDNTGIRPVITISKSIIG